MNLLWKTSPRLLSAYDRYALRSFIAHRARGVYEVLEEDGPASPCRYSNAEIWILVACIGLYAYHQCRRNTPSSGVDSIQLDLATSLLRKYGEQGLKEGASWKTVGQYFRWFGTKVERRYEEYTKAIDADLVSVATKPYFWSGELKARVQDRVLLPSQGQVTKRCDLLAYEISSFLLVVYPAILRVLAGPSLRRLALGWYVNRLDSFWVTYRAPPQ